MRDISGNEAVKLNRILQICRQTFEKYGFTPLETPAMENFEVLAAKGAGETIKDEIYYFKDKGDRELGLRFDFTVPLSRFVASNPNIPKPYRRYAIGPVWRYDNPQQFRYREFRQADIDIIGSSSPLADAECVACMAEVLQKLGFSDFIVRVNSRIVLESLIEKAGVPKEKAIDAIRIIDKLDKIGESGVKKELEDNKIKSSGILQLIKMKGRNAMEKIEGQNSDGMSELKEFLDCCKSFGIEDRIEVDASLARGLEYYTSLVFEITLPEQKVSFGGGGRYDTLIKALGGPDMPATGISIGIDRLLLLAPEISDKKKVFIATIGSVQNYAIEVAQSIRQNGFPCEMEIMGRGLSKQLAYASTIGANFVIIIGEKEFQAKKIKVRDMETGEEKLLKVEDFITSLKPK